MDFDVNISIPSWYPELKKLVGFEDAIIAGGFLRDQILSALNYKVPFKDIDVFIPLGMRGNYDLARSIGYHNDLFIEFLKKHNFDMTTLETNSNRVKGSTSATLLYKIRIKWKTENVYVEFMFVRETVRGFATRYPDTFPVNLQQISYDQNGLHPTKIFLDGLPRKSDFTERYLPPIFELVNDVTEKNLPKIIEKFSRLSQYIPEMHFSLGDYRLQKVEWDETFI